jgi:hypothetical protein
MLHNKINYKRNLSWVLVQNRQITDTAAKSSHYTFMVHLERLLYLADVISVLVSSVVDDGFDNRSSKTINYKIGICLFLC